MKNAHYNGIFYYQAISSFFSNILFISIFEEVLNSELCINNFETKAKMAGLNWFTNKLSSFNCYYH